MSDETIPPRKILIIANGKVAGEERLRCAVQAAREQGHAVHVAVTWEAGDAARFIGDAANADYQAVIAAGGDGTVNEVANALVAHQLPADCGMGVLPMGTANDFARGCGLPVDDLTAGLLEIARAPLTAVDLGRANDRIFANVATGGFGTQITVDTPPDVKRLLGRVAYLISGVKSLGSLQARKFTVRAPDFEWVGASYIFAIGNCRQAGGGFQLCQRAAIDDGLLDLMIVPDVPYDQALALLRDLLATSPAQQHDCLIYRQVPWIEIACEEPLSINLDGEPVSSMHFRFDVLPRALRMYLPAHSPVIQTRADSESATTQSNRG